MTSISWFLLLLLLLAGVVGCFLQVIQQQKTHDRTQHLERQRDILESQVRRQEQQILSLEESRINDTRQAHLETQIALREQKATLETLHQRATEQSVLASRRTLRGKTYEQFAAYLVEGAHPHDCRFLGGPIDFVVFKGADNIRCGDTREIDEVILVEVKTGKSKQTLIQKAIMRACTDGRVRYQVLHMEAQDGTEPNPVVGTNDTTTPIDPKSEK